MVGDAAAKALHLRPGGFLHIGKRKFRIAGIYHSGDRFVDLSATLPLTVVQALAQRPNEITTIGVTVKLDETPKVVAKRLARKFPGVIAVVEPG
jgi:putative ABC transport system permease protein